MKRFASLLFAGTAILAASCAHAATAPTTCPSNTVAMVVFQKSTSMPGFNIEAPPQTGANGEGGPQIWDISAANGKFYAECHANAQGKAGITPIEIPDGTREVIFTPGSGGTYR